MFLHTGPVRKKKLKNPKKSCGGVFQLLEDIKIRGTKQLL